MKKLLSLVVFIMITILSFTGIGCFEDEGSSAADDMMKLLLLQIIIDPCFGIYDRDCDNGYCCPTSYPYYYNGDCYSYNPGGATYCHLSESGDSIVPDIKNNESTIDETSDPMEAVGKIRSEK